MVGELRRTEGEDKVSSKSFKLRRSDMSVAANQKEAFKRRRCDKYFEVTTNLVRMN